MYRNANYKVLKETSRCDNRNSASNDLHWLIGRKIYMEGIHCCAIPQFY